MCLKIGKRFDRPALKSTLVKRMVSIQSQWILNSDTLNLVRLPAVHRQESVSIYDQSWSSIYITRIEPHYATPNLKFEIRNSSNRGITPYQLSLPVPGN